MDKLFGEVDAVAAGEEETSADKIEAITYSGRGMEDEKAINVTAIHVESGGDKKEA